MMRKNTDFHAYILGLCEKELNGHYAIDDEAKAMLGEVLATGSLQTVRRYENGTDDLISVIMYHEGLYAPEIGDDLIAYVLNIGRGA